MPGTLIRIFLDCVETRDKSAQFMRKNTGGWESISADRALTDVESLGLGLRHLGIRRGDRIAQIVPVRVAADLDFKEEASISPTRRGAGGFGHTGV